MKRNLFISLIVSLLVYDDGFTQGFIYNANEKDHDTKVVEWRKKKDIDYKDVKKTMLTEELMEDVSALKYYP